MSASLIGQRVGNFRVVSLLGMGGMGAVYEAVHEQIKRRVAIKVLLPMYSNDEEIIRRFFNEALAVNVVNHPALVNIFESGCLEDGSVYIVMEYLPGESLGTRLRREITLPIAEALRIGLKVAQALSAAHQHDIVHRDLKSDNVMLVRDSESDEPRVKVLDFGIAKVAARHQVNAVRTRDGVVMGTPEYMSPEQWISSRDVGEGADVYALGVLLFEMLVGQHPFSGLPTALMWKHLYDDPPALRSALPAAPASLDTLLTAMMAKKRAARPNMAQVAEQLLRCAKDNPEDGPRRVEPMGGPGGGPEGAPEEAIQMAPNPTLMDPPRRAAMEEDETRLVSKDNFPTRLGVAEPVAGSAPISAAPSLMPSSPQSMTWRVAVAGVALALVLLLWSLLRR